MFALEKEYPKLKSSVYYDYLNVMAEIMIHTNFNQPDSAILKIDELIASYQKEVGFETVKSFVAMKSLIEKNRGNYAVDFRGVDRY